MGQTLSEPITTKDSSTATNSDYNVGMSCMQGWRINMEDAHVCSLTPDEDSSASFFAVFDGHGGCKVAQYAEKHLQRKVFTTPAYKSGNVEEAIKSGFLSIDDDMLADDEYKEELSGTTAICALIKNKSIYCGNVGDSRAVISVCGEAEALSTDHKPVNEGEHKRITAAGGFVEFSRVNGNLALSRALGDFVFKKNEDKSAEEQIVTAYPEVTVRPITDDIEFLILACDGIWDVLTNQEVVDFVRHEISAKTPPEEICENLMDKCLAPECQMGGLGCDNMTVLLICFLHGQTYEALSERCARPKRGSGDTG